MKKKGINIFKKSILHIKKKGDQYIKKYILHMKQYWINIFVGRDTYDDIVPSYRKVKLAS